MFEISEHLPCLAKIAEAAHEHRSVTQIIYHEREYNDLFNRIHGTANLLKSFGLLGDIFSSVTTLNDAFTSHYDFHRKCLSTLYNELNLLKGDTFHLRKRYTNVPEFTEATAGVAAEVRSLTLRLQEIAQENDKFLVHTRRETKSILSLFSLTVTTSRAFVATYHEYLDRPKIDDLQTLLGFGGMAWPRVEDIYKIIEAPNSRLKKLMADRLKEKLTARLVDRSWQKPLFEFQPDRHAQWMSLISDRVNDARNAASADNHEPPHERAAKRIKIDISDDEYTNKSKEIFGKYKANVKHLSDFAFLIDEMVRHWNHMAIITSEKIR